MSGIAYLPPQPRKHSIRAALARLAARLRRRRPAGADPSPPDREACAVYPITAPVGEHRCAGSESLGVRLRRVREGTIVEAAGPLTLRTCDLLAEAIQNAIEDDGGQIILDLRELESIDHAGVDTILTADLRAGDECKQLVILAGPPRVQRLLDRIQGPFVYARARGGADAGAVRTRRRSTDLSVPRVRRTGHLHGARRSAD